MNSQTSCSKETFNVSCIESDGKEMATKSCCSPCTSMICLLRCYGLIAQSYVFDYVIVSHQVE